jgi:Ca2+/Na+ antiporter
MIKGLMREVTLAIQSKTGAVPAVFIWLAVVAVASLTAFAFLCVAAYAWLSTLFGDVFAGLIVAGFFIVVAAIAGMLCALARRRAKERAILERAARAHAGSWLLDPKILASAMQIGRSLGWQRIVPIALFGFIAAQWAREYRERDKEEAE